MDAQDLCRRLVALEDKIAAQRKFIGQLRAQELDAAGERERLRDLLVELDRLLHRDRVAA